MKTLQHGVLFGLALFYFGGCSSGDTTGEATSTGDAATSSTSTSSASTGGTTDPAACLRGSIEADFTTFGKLAGPGVDAATGKLSPLPSTAVVSSTYLALKGDPAAQKRFGELMGPLSKALQSQAGLLAVQLASSKSCGSARTLAVWKDEESLLGFVMSAPHAEAVASVGNVSRGESVVTSWETSDVEEATWESAAKRLSAQDGPYY